MPAATNANLVAPQSTHCPEKPCVWPRGQTAQALPSRPLAQVPASFLPQVWVDYQPSTPHLNQAWHDKYYKPFTTTVYIKNNWYLQRLKLKLCPDTLLQRYQSGKGKQVQIEFKFGQAQSVLHGVGSSLSPCLCCIRQVKFEFVRQRCVENKEAQEEQELQPQPQLRSQS